MSLAFDLLRNEVLKLKRSLALAVVVAAPILTTLLYFLVLMRESRTTPLPNAWGSYTQVVLQLWAFLALPMLVTLLTTLGNQVEHQHGMWKHLFAQPVPRAQVLLAKAGVNLVMMGVATALLLPLVLGLGRVVHLLKPGLGFGAPFPWLGAAQGIAKVYGAAWLMLALHQWISQRWASMAIGLGSGMLGLMGAFVVVNSKTWGVRYPWSLPLRASQPGSDLPQILALSVGGALLVWAYAAWDGSRRG